MIRVFLALAVFLSGCSMTFQKRREAATKSEEPAPPAGPVTLPAGFRFAIWVPTAISSSHNAPGSSVVAELAAPLITKGATVVPRGVPVTTIVDDATPARLSLRATQLKLGSGELVDISTDAPTFYAPKTLEFANGPKSTTGALGAPAVVPAESLVYFRLLNDVSIPN